MMAISTMMRRNGSPMKRNERELAETVMGLVEAIRPILAGHQALVQGAALADLLAAWLAGHHTNTTAETKRLRAELLKRHVALVHRLIPENET
jgi:hypothetical protein